LQRPISLPYELFAIRLGESLAQLATITAPALLVAGLVFRPAPPAGGYLAGSAAFAGWTAAMILAVAGAWRGVRRHLVIQCG
jgi:hypothetical protein